MQAILEEEALRDFVKLLLVLPFEMLCPFSHQILSKEDVTRESRCAIGQLPYGVWVELAVGWFE